MVVSVGVTLVFSRKEKSFHFCDLRFEHGHLLHMSGVIVVACRRWFGCVASNYLKLLDFHSHDVESTGLFIGLEFISRGLGLPLTYLRCIWGYGWPC